MNTASLNYTQESKRVRETYRKGCRAVALHWLELSDKMLDHRARQFALNRAIENHKTAQALEAA